MNIRHTIIVFAVATLCAGTAMGQTTSPAVDQTNRTFYDEAMKCFVANGHARGLRSRAGDVAKASAYGVKAREALGLATAAGQTIGLSNEQIKRDAASVEDRELPRMIQDNSYFIGTVATCKALGLM